MSGRCEQVPHDYNQLDACGEVTNDGFHAAEFKTKAFALGHCSVDALCPQSKQAAKVPARPPLVIPRSKDAATTWAVGDRATCSGGHYEQRLPVHPSTEGCS